MRTDSIVHPKLELSDPNPDIEELFVKFDTKFFGGKMKKEKVTVKWNARMTACAGACAFKGRREGCEITLSIPLLAFRKRKDMVEILLHEMIHAYLFIVDGDQETEEHGEKFRKHVKRINDREGCNITIYHSFYDEMDYWNHVWRCSSGQCKKKLPDRYIIKKTANRPPGPSDTWWQEHRKICDGKYVKISEPPKLNLSLRARSKSTSY